jgi:hypothetical protein
MKKLVASMLILTLPFILGCEKRLFKFVATMDQTSVYNLSSANGTFQEAHTITRDDVLGKLDIPKKAHITMVRIESLSLKVVKKQGNQAPAMAVSATLHGNMPTKKLFDNQTVSLVGIDVPFIGLNALIQDGIDGLKEVFAGYIVAFNNNNFDIQVTGNSVPAGQAIALDLQVIIKATVEYEECVETIRGTGGEKCDEDSTPTGP